MKSILTALSIMFLSVVSVCQTDSTDLILTTGAPVLQNQTDSVLFGNGYLDYFIEFSISDTLTFDRLIFELSTSGQLLNRKAYTLLELQADTSLFDDWTVNLDIGKFDSSQTYTVMLKICEFSGACGSAIYKTY